LFANKKAENSENIWISAFLIPNCMNGFGVGYTPPSKPKNIKFFTKPIIYSHIYRSNTLNALWTSLRCTKQCSSSKSCHVPIYSL